MGVVQSEAWAARGNVHEGEGKIPAGNVGRQVAPAGEGDRQYPIFSWSILSGIQTVDQWMFEELLGQPEPGWIMQQLANAGFKVSGARLQPALNAFANRAGNQADQQKHENNTDANI